MPAWLATAIAAIWKILEPYVAPLLAAKVGAELQKGQAAKDTLERVDEADSAAAESRGWSPDDRMRYLKQRGRVRDV